MAKLHFNDIEFKEEGGKIKGAFLRNFYFEISKAEMKKLGSYEVNKGDILVNGDENKIRRNFNTILEQKLKGLKSAFGKPAVYIYPGLIPLIGSLYFGVIDRNTNIIEVRPITGCNLSCMFCSVDLCRRERDFVVNVDYLVKEVEKLVMLKREKTKEIEIHINAQGEPLLYAPLVEMISKLKKIKGVKTISMDTNGTLLDEDKIDELVDAGITRFNVSLNAFSHEAANKIAGTAYPLEHVKKICRYIAKTCDILIAPVWMQGLNDGDIEQMIGFAKELKELRPKQKVPIIGIQNFLEYDFGKKPCREITFDEFYRKLAGLEKKHGIKLILSREDFGITACKVLKKPFDRDDYVKAKVICDGKFKGEKLCSAHDRIVSVQTNVKEGRQIGVRITRSKYNVFYGREI